MGSHGEFATTCRADAAVFPCLIDTGARGGGALLGIDIATARKAGIDVGRLQFNGMARTAANSIRGAKATVSRLQVGPFIVRDAPVIVNDTSFEMQLVATDFLRHYKITVSNGTMTITE